MEINFWSKHNAEIAAQTEKSTAIGLKEKRIKNKNELKSTIQNRWENVQIVLSMNKWLQAVIKVAKGHPTKC